MSGKVRISLTLEISKTPATCTSTRLVSAGRILVHVVFTGDASSAQGQAAASALINRGADVVGQSADGPTPQIVAQQRGVAATGHAVDLHELAPKSALCASTWAWYRYMLPQIKEIAAGNWQADPDSRAADGYRQ